MSESPEMFVAGVLVLLLAIYAIFCIISDSPEQLCEDSCATIEGEYVNNHYWNECLCYKNNSVVNVWVEGEK